jgi:hypothetical protein
MGTFVLPKFGSSAWRRLMAERRRRLKKMFPTGKVSPHFTYQEFATHDGTPIPIRAVGGLQALCKDFLEPMRRKFGPAFVLSGYRHRTYNAAIGGARNSVHIWDETPSSVAADMRFAKGTPAQWAAEAKRLRRARGKGGGVGTYPRMGFVHVDNRTYNADWSGT